MQCNVGDGISDETWRRAVMQYTDVIRVNPSPAAVQRLAELHKAAVRLAFRHIANEAAIPASSPPYLARDTPRLSPSGVGTLPLMVNPRKRTLDDDRPRRELGLTTDRGGSNPCSFELLVRRCPNASASQFMYGLSLGDTVGFKHIK